MSFARSNSQKEYPRPLIPVRKDRRSARQVPGTPLPPPTRITDPKKDGPHLAAGIIPLSSRSRLDVPKYKLDPTLPYSKLQDSSDNVQTEKTQLGVRSLRNLTSASASETVIGSSPTSQLPTPRRPRPLVIPPLPPHIRRCFAGNFELEPKKLRETRSLPRIPSKIDKIDTKFIPEEEDVKLLQGHRGQGAAPLPPTNHFRHPNEIRPNLNKVESYANLRSKVVWSDPLPKKQNVARSPRPSPQQQQSKTDKPTKSRLLFRSASLPQMSNMDNMQSRYLTDFEWRVCHAVNIYVYKNGVENQSPILVHIPPQMKATMKLVLQVLNDRIKYPIGYARSLYKMNGTKICDPGELEMYNNYVVASNKEKHFKCVPYGRRKSPLLVLNPQSKHTRAMRTQKEQLRCCLMAKKTSLDSLGYICPRGSMEVVRGIGCCQPAEAGIKGPGGKMSKRGRTPGKKAKQSRSKSSVQNRGKSDSPAKSFQKPSRSATLSPRSKAGDETRGGTAKSMDSVIPAGVKDKGRAPPLEVKMINEVTLDSALKQLTDFRDLKGYENNNNFVDDLIALQRSEHKFPPVSTGVSSTAYTMEVSPRLDHLFKNIYKGRSYSESEFEPDEGDDNESFNESDGRSSYIPPSERTNQNPPIPPPPAPRPTEDVASASVVSGIPAKSGTYKSPRGRTYTIRFHTPRASSDAELPHDDEAPRTECPTTSSWQNVYETSSSNLEPEEGEPRPWGAPQKPPVPRPRPGKTYGQSVPLESLLLIPPPPTVPHDPTVSDRSEFLLPPSSAFAGRKGSLISTRKTFSHEFNLENLDPDQQNYPASPVSWTRLENFQRNESNIFGYGGGSHFPRHLLQTRGFTPLEEDNLEARFWLALPRIKSSVEFINNNMFIPPPVRPPEIYTVQTDRSIQTTPPSDWMMSYLGQAKGRISYLSSNNVAGYSGAHDPELEKEDPDLIPPPSAFRNVTPLERGSSSNLIPPPSRFADVDLSQHDSSATSLLAQRGASKTKIQAKKMVVRRRPTLTYPVEDFIFKKGMKSPIRAPPAVPLRKSSSSKLKPKARFRR